MRTSFISCIATLVLASVSSGLAEDPPAAALSLERALAEALVRSPALRARKAELEQAEGRLQTAKLYPFNPELTVEAARREGPGDTTTDRGVKLAQEIQIGGQRSRGVAQASAELEATRAQLLREERLLAAHVRVAFVEALRARELLRVERANADLAGSLAEITRSRFESGAIAQMEVNLAQVQVGRAERDVRLAEAAYQVAKTVLAEVVGFDPLQPVELDGQLDLPAQQLLPAADVVAAAVAQRADLRAFQYHVDAARARIDLARRQRVPNVEVEAFYGREEGTDRLLGAEIKVRIPLFNRRQGQIAEAHAAHRQAMAEVSSTELQVRREVAVTLARYRASESAATSLQQQILGTLQENLELLQRSFEAGKTAWTEVLVFRREFVDIQREYIDTLTEARIAGIELDLASGINPAIVSEEPVP